MMEHKLKLKFDDSFNGILFSTQGDTGRVFEIEVRDELDNAIDITGHKLEFYVGNDSKVTKVEGTIQGNKFIVKPVNEQFTKSGLNKAQFVLYDPQGLQVGSQIFDLHVEESIQNGATVGRNVIVDFSKINEAVELIKGYEKTFEESKNLDTTLNAHIDEGKKVNQELISNTSAGQGLNKNLKTSTTKASETYTKLETSRTGADTLNNDLKANIASGNKTNANLQASISTAKSTQSTLQEKTAQGIDTSTKLGKSIKTGQDVVSKINTADKNLATSVGNAETAKTNLDASVGKANTTKTNLDASIDKANTAKKNLDTSTSQGNATDSKLRDTDTKASTSISTLQDLLNQSTTTEQNLKDIIASGNLDKYVTEPKLQEALAKIKTLNKEVVDTLPATGQDDVIYLVKDSKGKANNVYLEYLWINGAFELIGSTEVDLSGYAKKSDLIPYAKTSEVDSKISNIKIPSKLSELTDDSTHRLVTDAQRKAWDGKVDKVDGKGLSTNDFTNRDKAQIAESMAKIDGFNQYAQEINAKAEQALTNNAELDNKKADRTEIKTKLSEMVDDSTHRTVTDSEKSTWNSKLSTVVGQDVSRAKAKGYDSASSWQSVSNSRDLEDWIGDFDKRTRELKQLLDENYDDTTAAPGRKSLRAGNEMAGFFGTVLSSQFISGDELARKIGLTAGSSINSDTLWLKYIYLNKIEFIPLKPIRYNISWDSINNVDCVFGNKIININGINYKVRLIKGKSEGQQNDSSSSQGSIVLDSEWNKLLFPIHANSTTRNWKSAYNVENNGNIVSWRINYDNNDLGSDNSSGARCWCQELGSSGATRLCRGYEDISTTSNGIPSDAYADRGWRPCLELVEE